ncbi:MAG: ATP-binding protein [Bdellovibrionales bacterium]
MNSRIRISLVLLVVGLVFATIGLSLWRYVELDQVQTQKMRRDFVERQAAAARQLVEMANSTLHERMIDLTSREQTGRQLGLSPATEEALNSALNNSPFQAVALMRFTDRWQTSWVRQRPGMSSRWPESYTKSVLQDLPVESAKDNANTWFRVSGPAQQPLFLLISQLKDGAESVVAVGFLPATALTSVSEAFLGSDTEIAVVDERGVALAFSEQAYVGASLVDSYPPVSEVLRRREVSGQMNTQNRNKKPVLAASYKVEGSNLYVVATLPAENSWAMLPRLLLAFLIFAVALSLIGVAVGFWFLSPLESAFGYLQGQLMALAHGQPVGFFPRGNPYLDPLHDYIEKLAGMSLGESATPAASNQAEAQKMGAYKEISVGLADALRDPLAAVLAQAQLARGKSGNEEMKEHFVVIERETRKARDTIENLLRLSGEDRFPRSRVETQDVVLAALGAQKGLISSHNVKVVKELLQSAPIQAHAGQLQTALEEVIKNAVEATSKTAERLLKVSSLVSDTTVTVVIEDNGSGIEKTQLPKLFDPFYTTKGSEQHKGLGLTVVKGIVKSLGGQVRAESAGAGQGTKIIIEFPASHSRTSKMEIKPTLKPESAPANGLSKPLSGTSVDPLPVAPALDEVTFSGLKVVEQDALLSGDLVVPEDLAQEVARENPSSEEITVTVRSPKIKEPGT